MANEQILIFAIQVAMFRDVAPKMLLLEQFSCPCTEATCIVRDVQKAAKQFCDVMRASAADEMAKPDAVSLDAVKAKLADLGNPVTTDPPAHPLGCACGGPLCGQRPEGP